MLVMTVCGMAREDEDPDVDDDSKGGVSCSA